MACRIGTTSYIIPADILPNLRFLKNIVDDVELVLFESDEYSNLPGKADVREMRSIAEDAGLTFTVHLPLDAWPGAANEKLRKASADKWLRVMDRMATLSPFGWVIHFNDPPGAGNGQPWEHWLYQCGKTTDELLSQTEARRLCIETLSYDFSPVFPLVRTKGCSICLDIGHLLLTGRDVSACMDAWLDQTRIIHLHGVSGAGRDHVSLLHLDPNLLSHLLDALKNSGGDLRVLTLEIFSRKDLESSLSVLGKAI